MTGEACLDNLLHLMRQPCPQSVNTGRNPFCAAVRSPNNATPAFLRDGGSTVSTALSPRASSAPPPRHNDEPEWRHRLGGVSR